jgi:hypothetical protein
MGVFLLLCFAMASTSAREFRAIDPIATPAALPAEAVPLPRPRPIPRSEVERAVHAVADAWNSGALDPLLGDDFASKSRLLDTIADVVPRDARLKVLAVRAVSVISQYHQADRIVSTVSAVVHSEIAFNDPVTGYKRLEGTGDWYFAVEEPLDRPSIAMASETPSAAALAKPDGSGADDETLPAGAESVPEAMMGTLAATRSERAADEPYIDSVLPDPLHADSSIVIRGGNFGATAGVLQLVRREGRVVVPMRVTSWSDGQVTGELGFASGPAMPYRAREDLFRGLAEPGAVEAVLWLTRPRFAGIGIEVVFAREPEIADIVSANHLENLVGGAAHARDTGVPGWTVALTPGGTLELRGWNFLAEPGAVTFHVGGRDIAGDITTWSENTVTVTLPGSVDGLVAQMADLTLTNPAGDPVRQNDALYFWPRLVDRWALYTFELNCRRAIDDQPRAVMGGRLREGWEIMEAADLHYAYTPRPRGEHLCRFSSLSRPRPGDDSTRHTIACRCPPAVDYTIEGEVSVHLRGPAGTFYHDYR